MLFIGIDIGTTNCKISLYDREGFHKDTVKFRTPTNNSHSGWAEYNPELLWKKLQEGIRQLGQDSDFEQVRAISISSQAESGLLLDAAGKPVTPIIVWHDERTKGIKRWWQQNFNAEEVYGITGLDFNHIWSLMKLQWFKREQPEKFTGADKWLCVSDYFSYLLCGEAVMSYSLASRTMAFDIKKKEWSEELLERAGIPASIMPELAPSGTAIGSIKGELADRLDLPEDVQVVTGGHDHMCGCLGIGVHKKGESVVSIGTTISLCEYLDSLPCGMIEFKNKGYSIGRYVSPDAYYRIAGMPAGGLTLEWAINLFINDELNDEGFKEFNKLAQASRPGARGVLFTPHLRGCMAPRVDSEARGSFIGILESHNQADFCRAVLEGLCYEFRLVSEDKLRNKTLLAMGGGTKNRLWMELLADILGCKIIIPHVHDATTLGAALLGMIGSGLYRDIHQAVTHLEQEQTVVESDDTHQGVYDSVFKLYQGIYGATRDLNHQLGALDIPS